MKWKFLARPSRGGHKFYEHATIQGTAIADNSGTTPDDTDDGALWLDVSEKRRAVISIEHGKPAVLVGVTRSLPQGSSRDRDAGSTSITIDDLDWLLEQRRIDRRWVVVDVDLEIATEKMQRILKLLHAPVVEAHEVPPMLLQSLQDHCMHRRPGAGSFITAVLENDLQRACKAGSRESVAALPAIIEWLETNAPMASWGSPENVRRWRRSR
jgi:hypothetical protein